MSENKGALIGVIGDEDTVTGFLLAGVGNVDVRRKSNFLIVDNSEYPTPLPPRALRSPSVPNGKEGQEGASIRLPRTRPSLHTFFSFRCFALEEDHGVGKKKNKNI